MPSSRTKHYDQPRLAATRWRSAFSERSEKRSAVASRLTSAACAHFPSTAYNFREEQEPRLNISILAAGAGGMYCGSCMRDSALATALKRQGHDVTLIPLYTPLRDEHPDASHPEVFYGGINVYLQHASRLFRHTPRMLDWIFDRPWLLNAAGRMGAQTSPKKLAGLTQSILEGEEGAASKELDRLVHFLRNTIKPQVICLPNLMFIGMARTFKEALGVPVVCEMTGEDIFLDAMDGPDRQRIRQIIQSRAADANRLVATSHYYASHMADYLEMPVDQIDVVPNGISSDYFQPRDKHKEKPDSAPTVGYLARICPEKGLAPFIEAMKILLTFPDLQSARFKVAGYLGKRDEKWFTDLRRQIETDGLSDRFEFLGEVDLPAKLNMLDSLDVFSVPTVYPEAKGIYVLEAMARGIPVVQPAHGSFPELIEQTQGGLLVPPNNPGALAEAIAGLLRDPARRRAMGRAGKAAVESSFTEDHMARNMLNVFQSVLQSEARMVQA